MEWFIPLIFAISGGLVIYADQCDEYRYQRCVAIYGNLCDDPREYVELTRGWKCQ